MTSTAIETTVDTTTTAPATTTSKTPVKATDTDYTKITTAKLESDATKFVTAGNKAGMSLAGILVALYSREAWTEHDQAAVDYFITTIGIGESGFSLPKQGRQELVRLMAAVAPDAPISIIAMMTGCSLRTVARDRSEFDLANPARVNSHKPADDDQDDDQDAGDDTTDTPAKATKSRKSSVDIGEVISQTTDVSALMAWRTQIDKHIAELLTADQDAA